MSRWARSSTPKAPKPRRTAAQIAKARRDSERRHELHLAKTYGITSAEYEAIKEAQGGVCYICQRANGSTRRLAVDHDHATGYIRGLLCKSDNRLLGFARDSIEFFQRCIDYLTNPPAFAVIGQRKVPENVQS